MDMRALERDLVRFRSAIDAYVHATPHRFLKGFPNQACKTVSMLTARFLRESGRGDAELVANGNRSRKRSARDTHAWLCLEGYLIDLTADQFEGEARTVLVVPDGTSRLHRTFRGQRRFAWDAYMRFNSAYQDEHDEMYAGIMRCLVNEPASRG
jgi:hypothetical protein